MCAINSSANKNSSSFPALPNKTSSTSLNAKPTCTDDNRNILANPRYNQATSTIHSRYQSIPSIDAYLSVKSWNLGEKKLKILILSTTHVRNNSYTFFQ